MYSRLPVFAPGPVFVSQRRVVRSRSSPLRQDIASIRAKQQEYEDRLDFKVSLLSDVVRDNVTSLTNLVVSQTAATVQAVEKRTDDKTSQAVAKVDRAVLELKQELKQELAPIKAQLNALRVIADVLVGGGVLAAVLSWVLSHGNGSVLIASSGAALPWMIAGMAVVALLVSVGRAAAVPPRGETAPSG